MNAVAEAMNSYSTIEFPFMENGGFAVANRSPKQAITHGPLFGLCRAVARLLGFP